MDWFETARKLRQTKAWMLYLSKEHGQIFEQVSESQKLWKEFLDKPDSISAALEIRRMLTEQQLCHLYPKDYVSSLFVDDLPIKETHEVEVDLQPFIPIDDQYHTLELDLDILSRPELLELEQLPDEDEQESDEESGKVLETYRNLFSYLQQANPNEYRDIRKIITDARPSKSKWASDDRVGQEQLYSALEKTLTLLRNYSDHSLPFLKPVQKREAPHYYDIIKNPMDLGTMSKKLKALQYQSKIEFEKDLNLIWNNCLTYNTQPDSIYRRHAEAMRKRANDLLKNVPDVQIHAPGEDEESDNETGDKLTTVGSLVDLASTQTIQDKPETPAPEPVEDNLDEERRMEREQELLEELMEQCSLFERHYRKSLIPIKRRLLKRSSENHQLQFSEQKSWPHSEERMQHYLEEQRQYIKRNNLRRKLFSQGMDQEKLQEPPSVFRSHTLPELNSFHNCAPVSVPVKPRFPGEWSEFMYDDYGQEPYIPVAPMPSMSEYPELRIDLESKLNQEMIKNCDHLLTIKQTFYKILDRLNLMSTDIVQSLDLPPPIPFEPLWKREDLPPLHLDQRAGASVMKQSCAHILLHQGFDGATEDTLNTLTDVACQYMKTLSATIVYNTERKTNHTTEDILIASLFESGLGIQDLSQFIRNDIFIYGEKIQDTRKKMDAACYNIEGEMRDDVVFENYDDHIMSGNFFDDLDIDLLNLKDFGLEFKNVPMSLWGHKAKGPIRAHVKRSLLNIEQSQDNAEPDYKTMQPPEPWQPVNPVLMIGLLRGFYQSLEAEPDAMIEDEFKPKSKEAKMLVKLAQTGKKRQVPMAEEVKKKKKADPQQKAQKEAEKAKKQALKLEKAKMKEMKKKQ
ncbi:hypothetical protein EDD86DRAFT_211955 [Gorgonomyces haynaldii]|nr:hypothetical protein EDD86DRAFT_211955 [Gorgonomyces haynaldii]